MGIEYYELPGAEVVTAPELVLPVSKHLYDAIQCHKEYKLVQLLKLTFSGQIKCEYLIVDVTCDQVPSQFAHGILYRERLALEVQNEHNTLVNVIALRKNFPILLHQNQTRWGTPAQLCLYFDSPRNVLRTWTPQNFLKRIIWWIEKSSRGELHPSDQPVENLFFASRFELVLPWNFSAQQKAGVEFTFLRGRERHDKGITVFAWPAKSLGAEDQSKRIAAIECELPALVHGQVEQDPFFAGDLVDMFNSKGIDLIEHLKNKLRLEEGTVADMAADQEMLLIMINIPIKRTEDGEIESISRRALIFPMGPLSLGIKIGFLTVHNNQVINDFMGQIDRSAGAIWHSIPFDSMTVLYFNTAEKARFKSGIVDTGPNGLIVGAGALGSALLVIWVRSGWGVWKVIDDDHLRPHNLSRHIGIATDVGVPKANLVAEHCHDITLGAVDVTAFSIDGCQFSNEVLMDAHKSSALVIDASTTLDYPRTASLRDDISRHVTVFITPNGDSAVLLAEDQNRTVRLRTLEAQYYRALLNGELGDHNIHSSQGSFISGSSCRDISVIMPYSKILNHASTLAEQIISLSAAPGIYVWNRNKTNGNVTFHQVTPMPELQLGIDDFHFYIDSGLIDKIRYLRKSAFPNETGGILLGYYDLNIRAIIAVDALPAPIDSQATPHSFKRGVEGTKENVASITTKTADMVNYIGEWHSHPPGHSANPSNDDYFQIFFLALGMAEDGLPAISLIVGEDDLQVLKCEVQ